MTSDHKLQYLPLFIKDMEDTYFHIARRLGNPAAAEGLIDKTEAAILERAKSPEGYEPYPSEKTREQAYYRIYVDNFTVFCTLSEGVMEIRRFLYSKRRLDSTL